jgi:hypothetical protein
MPTPSTDSTWPRIRGELLLKPHPPSMRFLIYGICLGGLLVPLHYLLHRPSQDCVLSQQLLVSDPLTKSKSELSSGLELLGLAGRTDEPTLKAVIESQSVTEQMTQRLLQRHPGNSDVARLVNQINQAQQTANDDSPLQVKQKRGDRFQDLSIITISLRGEPELLRRIQPDIREFYRSFGLDYRSGRSDKALAFANAQLDRLRRAYDDANQQMQQIRLSLGGFTPEAVLTLAKDNYSLLESAVNKEMLDNAEAFASSTPKGGALSDLIVKAKLQPLITSIPFKRLITSYNNIRSRYTLLSRSRQSSDQELIALKNRLSDLEAEIKDQLRGVELNTSDIPSTPAAYDAFEREVTNKVKMNSLQKQSSEKKDYYARLAIKAQALISRYLFLEEDAKSTVTVLATYRQLKERLVLDSAKELSSWSIIGSNIQCQKLPWHLLAVFSILLYSTLLLFLLSPTLRKLFREKGQSIVSSISRY